MLPLSYVCRQRLALLARNKDIDFLVISTHLLMTTASNTQKKTHKQLTINKKIHSIIHNNNEINVTELVKIKN